MDIVAITTPIASNKQRLRKASDVPVVAFQFKMCLPMVLFTVFHFLLFFDSYRCFISLEVKFLEYISVINTDNYTLNSDK